MNDISPTPHLTKDTRPDIVLLTAVCSHQRARLAKEIKGA